MGRLRLKDDDKKENLTIRISPEERLALEANATKYCPRIDKKTGKTVGFNMSKWLRYAGTNCKPNKDDLTDDED